MFIDYVTLMLVNMAAGFLLLACFVMWGINADDKRKWVPPFAVVGGIAFLTGLHMSFTWPLIGAYNIAFGELSVMLGALFLGAALALAKGWTLGPLAVYAIPAGLAAIVVGLRIANTEMTRSPVMAGVGFVLSGLGGLAALPVVILRRSVFVRFLASVTLVLVAGLWGFVGLAAYWGHVQPDEGFGKWKPAPMRAMQPAPEADGNGGESGDGS